MDVNAEDLLYPEIPIAKSTLAFRRLATGFSNNEYLNQFCPEYRSAVVQLEKSLAACEESRICSEIIEEFAGNYLTPKKYWDCLRFVKTKKGLKGNLPEMISITMETLGLDSFLEISLLTVPFESYIKNKLLIITKTIFSTIPFSEKNERELKLNAYYHFYFEECIRGVDQVLYGSQCSMYLKLLKFKNKVNFNDRDLTFPNAHLRKAFQDFESDSTHELSKTFVNKIKKMLDLYEKICAAEKKNNSKKWFQLLCQAEDHQFLCHNVEHSLGLNFFNTDLWKLYIEYLRENNPKEMLHAFSKYCRFFMDDLEMKEKYKQAMEEYGPINLPWKNLFDFENGESTEKNLFPFLIDNKKDLRTLLEAEKLPNFSSSYNKILPSMFYQNYRNHQNFSFRLPLVFHILQSANPAVLKKLFKTCKYFFTKKPTPICFNFCATNYDKHTVFFAESINVNCKKTDKKYYQNILISTTFNADFSYKNPMDASSVSKMIPCFFECHAKYITIEHQNLTFDELKFFIKSCNVVHLTLDRVKITTAENGICMMQLEKIMEYLPNIEKLKLDNKIEITSNTLKCLLRQKFYGKFNAVCLTNIVNQSFDAYQLRNFCIKNRAEYIFLKLQFSNTLIPEFENHLRTVFCDFPTQKIHLGILANNELVIRRHTP